MNNKVTQKMSIVFYSAEERITQNRQDAMNVKNNSFDRINDFP